jgi:hypothetical protein
MWPLITPILGISPEYFSNSWFANPPLRVLADGEDGPNGVYKYRSFLKILTFTNYWVDVVLEY